MKAKTLLSVLALSIIISAFSQKSTMELTFTAENSGQYVPLDSIIIENLMQGGDTTLYAPDTVLVLDYITSIVDNEVVEKKTFSISQNYPNPFKGETKVNLYLYEEGKIKISIRDILGRKLVNFENTLKHGNHFFSFYLGNEKYYLLTVTGRQTSQTVKLLNSDSHTANFGKCKIVYIGSKDDVKGFKAQRLSGVAPVLTQKTINIFGFNLGDELKYTAYADNVERTLIDSPMDSQTYTFEYANGIPCPGMPTVADIDGNTYSTIQIGSQCWMAENLKTTTYQNTTPIPNVIDDNEWCNLATGAYVWYENDVIWKDPYGALYSWYATVDSGGLCPTGWHVPTHYEWTTLTDFIGGINTPQGNDLKSCRQVNSPLGGECNTTEHPRWNENNTHYGTDDYGFSGLPGGYRHFCGEFNYLGDRSYWWSSTDLSLTFYTAWYRIMDSYSGGIGAHDATVTNGFSVRCLRD